MMLDLQNTARTQALPDTRVPDRVLEHDYPGGAYTDSAFVGASRIPSRVRPALSGDFVLWLLVVFAAVATVLGVAQLLVAAPTAGVDVHLEGGWQPVAGVISASAIVVGMLWLALSRLELYAPAPARLAGLAVWWGIASAAMLSLLANTALSPLDAGQNLAVRLGLPVLAEGFGTAWPNEIVKALGMWMVLWVGRAWWNKPWHGIAAGALVGLGFQAYADSLNAVSLAHLDPVADGTGALGAYTTSALVGFGLHVFCSAIVGFGVGQAMFGGSVTRGMIWRTANALGWGLLGFLLHFAWCVGWELGQVDVVNIIAWVAAAVIAAALIGGCEAMLRRRAHVAPGVRETMTPGKQRR